MNLKPVLRDELEIHKASGSWLKRLEDGSVVPFFTVSSARIVYDPVAGNPDPIHEAARYTVAERRSALRAPAVRRSFEVALDEAQRAVLHYLETVLEYHQLPMTTPILCIGGTKPDVRTGRNNDGAWLEARIDIALPAGRSFPG
jgi:hypothetical protein